MMNKSVDDKMLKKIRGELDKSCESLDGQTLSRLNKIRHDALEQKSSSSKNWALLTPFGGLVSASVVLLVIMFWQQEAPIIDFTIPSTSSTIEDLEILSSADSIEFYEDFEFYQWLAENDISV